MCTFNTNCVYLVGNYLCLDVRSTKLDIYDVYFSLSLFPSLTIYRFRNCTFQVSHKLLIVIEHKLHLNGNCEARFHKTVHFFTLVCTHVYASSRACDTHRPVPLLHTISCCIFVIILLSPESCVCYFTFSHCQELFFYLVVYVCTL